MVIASDDATLAFEVWSVEGSVEVHRTQAVAGVGSMTHIMRFESKHQFDEACKVDSQKFVYPHLYWRLSRSVEDLLNHGEGRSTDS